MCGAVSCQSLAELGAELRRGAQVSVATSLEAPIKLLFPRIVEEGSSKAPFSMLGLGDIVIPGVQISSWRRLAGARCLARLFSFAYSSPDSADCWRLARHLCGAHLAV